MREDLLPKTYEGALTRVVQEAAEVIQAITKLQQYGSVATDQKTGISYNNVMDMLTEFNDLEHAMTVIRGYHRLRGQFVPMPDIPMLIPSERRT